DPRALVDYLRTCVTFEEDERGEIAKKIAGYHQFRAVRKARASVLASLRPPSGAGDGRGGVIWHTQGSGKSLTMLMLAGALFREALPNATFVGFTGTPIERDDKNTIRVFGECADVYDIRQAVEDGATKPLFYESRIVKLTVDEEGAKAAEEKLKEVTAADASG